MAKYCGSAKNFPEYGFMNVSICLDEIPEEDIKHHQNGKRYVSLKVSPRQQPDQYGNTHSVKIDEYKKGAK